MKNKIPTLHILQRDSYAVKSAKIFMLARFVKKKFIHRIAMVTYCVAK